MPLESRYAPSDLRSVIQVGFTAKAPRAIAGGIDAPAYYENDNAIVLDAATDKTNQSLQTVQTIEQAFASLNGLSDSDKAKKIIIPVAEQQNILGIFPRNHWVTLYYDPATNQATLLDSRPWIVSFLYPTSAMKKALMSGLARVFDPAVISNTRFVTRYQGVQHNDIYCGAWTSHNIRDLAGANLAGKLHSIDEQVKAYTSFSEPLVVARNKELVGSRNSTIDVLELPYKPGYWQRIFAFFGFGRARQMDVCSVSQPNESYRVMGNAGLPTVPKLQGRADDWDDDDLLVTDGLGSKALVASEVDEKKEGDELTHSSSGLEIQSETETIYVII